MDRRNVLAGAAVALAGCAGVASGPDRNAAESAVITQLNDLRSERGLGELPVSDHLRTVARDHCRDMAERDFFAHETPDGVGPGQRAGCAAGETLYRGDVGVIETAEGEEFNTSTADELAAAVVSGWRGSSAHAEIIFDRRWQGVGAGVVVTEGREFFATALFC